MAMPAATAMPIRAAAIGAREDGAPAARSASRPTCRGAHGTGRALPRGVRAPRGRRASSLPERRVGIGARRRRAPPARGRPRDRGRPPTIRAPAASPADLVGDRGLEQRLRRDGAVAQRRRPVARRRRCGGRRRARSGRRARRRARAARRPAFRPRPAAARPRRTRARRPAPPAGSATSSRPPSRRATRTPRRLPPTSTRSPTGDAGMPVASRYASATKYARGGGSSIGQSRRTPRTATSAPPTRAASTSDPAVQDPSAIARVSAMPDARDDARAAPVGLVPGGVAGECAHGRDDAETQLPRGPAREERHEHADPGTQRPPASGAHPTQHIGRPHRGVLASRPRTAGSGPCRPTPARRRRTA